MIVIVLPYQLPPRPLTAPPKDDDTAKRALKKLRLFMGQIPSDIRILSDRDPLGRFIANEIGQELANSQLHIIQWRKSPTRPDLNTDMFNPVFGAMQTIDAPGLIMVVPGSLAMRYAAHVGSLMGIRNPALSTDNTSKIIILDQRASDPVRLLAY